MNLDPLALLLWGLGLKATAEIAVATWIARRIGDLADSMRELAEKVAKVEGRLEADSRRH